MTATTKASFRAKTTPPTTTTKSVDATAGASSAGAVTPPTEQWYCFAGGGGEVVVVNDLADADFLTGAGVAVTGLKMVTTSSTGGKGVRDVRVASEAVVAETIEGMATVY